MSGLCAVCRELDGQLSIEDALEWDPTAHARRDEPTSLEAARVLVPTVEGQLDELLGVYASGFSWTDREAGSRTALPPDGWSKRAADLRARGWTEHVRDELGEIVTRRDEQTRRRANLSRITRDGEERLRSLS